MNPNAKDQAMPTLTPEIRTQLHTALKDAVIEHPTLGAPRTLDAGKMGASFGDGLAALEALAEKLYPTIAADLPLVKQLVPGAGDVIDKSTDAAAKIAAAVQATAAAAVAIAAVVHKVA